MHFSGFTKHILHTSKGTVSGESHFYNDFKMANIVMDGEKSNKKHSLPFMNFEFSLANIINTLSGYDSRKKYAKIIVSQAAFRTFLEVFS